jgi:hypothetical protein
MKKVLIIVLIILCIPVVSILGFIRYTAHKTAQAAYGVVDKTLDTDNIINNYEWFKMQYNSYQQIKGNIEDAENTVKDFEKSA